MVRIATPTSISRHSSRSSPTGRACGDSRRCSGFATRSTSRPAERTPGRPSCSTSPSSPCACAVRSSTPYGHRACSSSISRVYRSATPRIGPFRRTRSIPARRGSAAAQRRERRRRSKPYASRRGCPAWTCSQISLTRTVVHRGVEGGNPDLDPETADTLTLGFVLNSWSKQRVARRECRCPSDWYRFEIRRCDRIRLRPDLRSAVL